MKTHFFNLLDAHNNSYNLSPLYVLWVSEILFNIFSGNGTLYYNGQKSNPISHFLILLVN